MNVTKYLKNLGHDTVPGSFYSLINTWENWYRNSVKGFHTYRIYNGREHIPVKRYSLGMAKKTSEDIADLLLNERVSIVAADAVSDTYLQAVLNKNRFLVIGNDYQERKAYTGTVAYIPCLNGIRISEDGHLIGREGSVDINFVSAANIFPLSWENSEITECAFSFFKTVKGKQFANIQLHLIQMTGGQPEYVIENHVVECTEGAGKELSVDKWKELPPFASLQPKIHTGSTRRQFVIDRLNIVNNTSEDNPMGVALFANSLDQLRGLDTTYDSYVNEFVLGKKRVFVAPEMMAVNELGDPVFDPNDVVFYKLPEDTLRGDKPIVESNMELRSDEHNKALNDGLNILSIKTGFGPKHYKFEQGNVTTATQVISENSDMFRTLKKHEIILEDVLKELAQIILRLGQTLGNAVDPETEITIDFDDSIIEDKQSERQQDRQDVAMGAMTLLDYRMKWYQEDAEEAAKHITSDEVPPDGEEE